MALDGFSDPQKAGRIVDIVGKRFNDLVVTGFAGMMGKNAHWRCTCDCGNEDFVVAGNLLRKGNTKSCGCRKHRPAVNKDSTESFIRKSKERHGDYLNYSKVDYQGGKSEIILICPVHGEFYTKGIDHLTAKHPCPQCARDSTTKKQSFTKEMFAQKAKEVHGDTYDYSLVEYKTARKKVTIKCRVHGPFDQVPYVHTKGGGCPVCASLSQGDFLRSNKDEFIKKARVIHGDAYDYSNVEYITARLPVEIICNTTQQKFCQTPDNHLRGMACSCCANCGFDQGRTGVLYVLQADDWLKIGITNLTPEDRCKSINKKSPRKFSTLTYYLLDGVSCNRIETELLRWLRKAAKPVREKFQGYTETFYDISPTVLLNKMEEFING